jgi:pimeloyl-ACP methyl ester carboxylesterase
VQRRPELKMLSANGQELAVWEWPGADPPFLLAHATGFHARCWDQIVQEFPERRCLAVDARGHGRSSKTEPPCAWRPFGQDLAAIAEAFAVRDAVGIGHSMGGHVTVQCAALRPETYRALVLVDPTIFSEELYGRPLPDLSFTLRRKNSWTGPEEMFERFKGRMPFVQWRPEILRDYCEHGLTREGDHFVLACPPAVETSIYENSRNAASNVYPEIAGIRHPVMVVRARRTRKPDVFEMSASPTSPNLASRFAHGRERVLMDASHFIAMEHPEVVVEEVRAMEGEGTV